MSRLSSLLQKANTQLKGERVPIKSREEDELSKYLSNLTQKTGQQTKSVNFEDLGENISISSESNLQKTPRSARAQTPTLGGAASRFLKKKTPDVGTQDQGKTTPIASPRGPRRPYRPATSIPGTPPTNSTPVQAKTTPSPQKPTALDKAKALTNKINDRGAHINKRGAYFETDTDDSVSLANYMQHASADQLKSASEKSIGRDGNRFLKKTKAEKPLEETENAVMQRIEAPRPSTPSKGQRRPFTDRDAPKPASTPPVPEYAHKGQKKYLSTIQLTSEEESMADFIHRLSSADEVRNRKKAAENRKVKGRDMQSPDLSFRRTPSPPSRTPKRTPSPIVGRKYSRSPSQDSDNVDSIRSEVADTQETDSSGNIFNTINLMDLDTLEPMALSPEPAKKKSKSKKKRKKESKSKPKTKSKEASPSIFKASGKEDIFKAKSSPSKSKKKDAKKSNSFFTGLGLQTVDDLLGASENREESLASEPSEIITDKSDIFAARKRKESVSSIASDIVQEESPQQIYTESFEDESISERIGQGGKQVRWSVASEVKTEYSDETTQADYDDDFESDSRVRSHIKAYESETDGYTSDTETDTPSYTKSRRPTSPRPSHKAETRSVEIQTGTEPGLGYNWNMSSSGLAISGPSYGLGFVDPTPIASHVVSADALEAMTSYSPCMLALQDLLKQQLVLTQNFLATQKRIYEASTATLEENYKYTTLEGTKEYIRKHRKPRLTFKQALKMVSREMDR